MAPLSHLAGRAVGRSELTVSRSPQGRDCARGGRDAALPAAVCRGWVLSGPGVNQTLFLGRVGLMEPRTFSMSRHPETRKMNPQLAPSSEALQGPCPPAAGRLPPCPA